MRCLCSVRSSSAVHHRFCFSDMLGPLVCVIVLIFLGLTPEGVRSVSPFPHFHFPSSSSRLVEATHRFPSPGADDSALPVAATGRYPITATCATPVEAIGRSPVALTGRSPMASTRSSSSFCGPAICRVSRDKFSRAPCFDSLSM